MKKAVAYARFSSDMQREESIDAQIRAIKYYATQYNYDIIRVYTDKAQSGRSADRPQFLQMIKDSEHHEFEAVIVHKLDRFSRDSTDTALYERELNRNGVELVSVNEKLDNTPEGLLMKQIIIGMNQFYSANLAREVMKGLKENAYNCKHTGGIPPLGYDVGTDKKYIINETEACAVKLIFELYTQGCGYTEIIHELTRCGYHTKKGNSFGKNSLYEILKNEKYTGVLIYNRSESMSKKGTYNRHKYKDEKDIIRVEGGIPRIIDKDTFRAAQKRLQQNKQKRAANKAKAFYLLSGLLQCGHCGGSLVGGAHRYRGKEYSYYICANQKRLKNCNKKNMDKRLLEEAVVNEINHAIFSEENIDAICQRIHDSYQAAPHSSQEKIAQLKQELSLLTQKINNLYRAIEDGLDYDETMKRIRERVKEKEAIEIKMIELDCIKQPEHKTVEQLKQAFRAFASVKNLPQKQQKAVLNRFIDKIIVTDTPKGFLIRIRINPHEISPYEFSDIVGGEGEI